MIDWFCWLLILAGLLLMLGSRLLHRNIGMPAAAWLVVGVVILLFGIWRFEF
jgi:hypothetical protein